MSGKKCIRLSLAAVLWSMGVCLGAVGADGAGQNGVIRATATLQAGESTLLRCEVAPEARLLMVVPQGKVGKGDLLVEFDDRAFVEQRRDQEIRIFEVESQLEAARMALTAEEREADLAIGMAEQRLHLAEEAVAAYLAGEYPDHLASAENDVVQAQLSLASVESRYAQEDSSVEPGSREDLEIRRARMRLEEARKRLRMRREYILPRRKGELELGVTQARIELEQARQRQAQAMHRRRTEMKLAQMRLERETARMEYFEAQLAACRVHAPYDGTVRHEWRPLTRDPLGERFAPGVLVYTRQPLVRVESMEHPKLFLCVAAERAEQVSSGQEATIRFHAFSQETFEGHVTEVRLMPSAGGGAPEGVIVVVVDDPSERLQAGMSAVVEIE